MERNIRHDKISGGIIAGNLIRTIAKSESQVVLLRVSIGEFFLAPAFFEVCWKVLRVTR